MSATIKHRRSTTANYIPAPTPGDTSGVGEFVLGVSDGGPTAHIGILDAAGTGTAWEPVNLGASPTGDPMIWQGAWDPARTYQPEDVVVDGSWTMIALVDTDQRPSPQPIGEPVNVYAGASPTRQATAKSVTFGNRYRFTENKLTTSIRLYTVTGNFYSLYVVKDPDGEGLIEQIISYTARTTGWATFSVTAIISPNVDYELRVAAQEPDPAPVTFSSDWNYLTPNNADVPLSGQVLQPDKALGSFRVHKFDNGGTDRSAQLASYTPGDTISCLGIRYSISGVVDNGTWIDFTVAPAIQGTPDGVTSITFETVTATPITIVDDVGWWAANGDGQVQGLFSADGNPPVLDTNAYGVDWAVQNVSVPTDWDTVAYSGNSSGGSGGVLPDGGGVDDILVKLSTDDGDAGWTNTIDGGTFP